MRKCNNYKLIPKVANEAKNILLTPQLRSATPLPDASQASFSDPFVALVPRNTCENTVN